jgi:predicted permease
VFAQRNAFAQNDNLWRKMASNLIVFSIIIGLGILFQYLKPAKIDADTAKRVINTVIINFCLPALCFKVIASMEINRDVIFFPMTAISTVLSCLILSYLAYTFLGKFVRIQKREKGAMIMTSSFGNITFFGIPILTGIYGIEAIKFPLLYDLAGSAIILWTAGTMICSYYSGGQKASLKSGLKNLAAMPPIWAMVFGFAANFSGIGFHLPDIFINLLDLLSQPIIPLMTFSIGLMLKAPKLKYIFLAMPSVLIKLCLSPFLAFLFALVFGLDGLAFKAVIVESALPVMTLSLVLVSQYGLDETLAALTAIITIALSFITIPIAVFLIG